MATDPNIILAAGNINDPARLAQSQMMQYEAAQARQQMAGQNALKQVFAQPGALTPDGQVAPNALAAVMRIDPQTGLQLAQQNRQAMLDQLHIKAAELGNTMSQTELGKAKWDWMTSIAAATTDAYDNAVKSGADPQRALAAATQTRDEMLRKNGGQMSEEEEQAALSRPLNMDEARAMAGQNKDYLANKKLNQQFQFEEGKEQFAEQAKAAELTETKRHDLAEEDKPVSIGENGLYYPKSGKVVGADAVSAGSGAPSDPISYVMGNEGGYAAHDGNGAPVNMGINAKANSDRLRQMGVSDIKDLTPEQARAIYADYWQQSGAEKLPPNAQAPYFDAYIRSPAAAQRIWKQSGGDPVKFATTARNYFQNLAQEPKYARFKEAWAARDAKNIEIASSGGGMSDEDSMAKGIANYSLAPLTGFALRSARGQRIMAKVEQMNPSYDQSIWTEKNKAMRDFGTGPQGNLARSMNVAISHLSVLQALAQGMQNDHIPLVNSAKNWLSKNAGYANVNSFEAARNIAATEVTKAIMGSGVGAGALADREEALRQINSSSSWQQLAGVISTWKQLLAGQLQGLKAQYESSTGRNDFIQREKLSPITLKALGEGGPAPKPSKVLKFDAQGNLVQ